MCNGKKLLLLKIENRKNKNNGKFCVFFDAILIQVTAAMVYSQLSVISTEILKKKIQIILLLIY